MRQVEEHGDIDDNYYVLIVRPGIALEVGK